MEVATIFLDAAKNEHPPLRIRTSKWAEDFCNLKIQADHDRTKLVQQIKKPFL
ncbi:hypothetical protein [uncultured Maribacter sp.]|uniref:hypothetical protein n=1 Tax=uncultured Maribacter sp. TaxID=431308 RepID=UPI002628BB26|nr:hypothetical protein [uncultured Maribacter sp.]